MSNQKIDLEVLKTRNIPHAKAESFLVIKQDSDEARKAMDQASEYFSHFVEGTPGGPCINCGKNQGAKDMVSGLLGGAQFAWGICHGEGFCRNCGYPARAHHEVPGVGRITNLILQYHPDELDQPQTNHQMTATIEESKYGFYIKLEATTLDEGATIVRCGLNRNAIPETYVHASEKSFSISLSFKKTPNDSNYVNPVWSKK